MNKILGNKVNICSGCKVGACAVVVKVIQELKEKRKFLVL